jgi:hypothetical protein
MAAGATEVGAMAVRALLSALGMAVAGAIGIRTDAADGEQTRATATAGVFFAIAASPGSRRIDPGPAQQRGQLYVDDRTIDSHIKRLRKKFKQVEDSFDMIETLYGVGYRFKE